LFFFIQKGEMIKPAVCAVFR